MINNELKAAVVSDIVTMHREGINVVLVHGGGPEIEIMLKAVGRESRFINGLRYTDEKTMEIVQMVLCGKVNKDLVALLQLAGASAIGLCGIDGALLEAERETCGANGAFHPAFTMERAIFTQGAIGGDLGLVGKITNVNVKFLQLIMKIGVPVISSVALGSGAGAALSLNVNADTAAAHIAAACKAEKLILMTDIAGILRDVNKSETLIKNIDRAGLAKLKAEGIISAGMIPKVECCETALAGGVGEVHIIDGRVPHAILAALSGKTDGTVVR
jgi:acetylglutamate kinase